MIKKLWYKILWYGYVMWIYVKWFEWNPWVFGGLNLAWTNYTKTSIYEERKKINYVTLKPGYEDYATQAYVDNMEPLFFKSRFTWKDKLRIIFLPYSCGNKYKMPFYLIRNRVVNTINWLLGTKEED